MFLFLQLIHSKIAFVRLNVATAFHSPVVDEIQESFMNAIAGIGMRWKHPNIPFFSTVTGVKHEGPFDENYWWRNIRNCV